MQTLVLRTNEAVDNMRFIMCDKPKTTKSAEEFLAEMQSMWVWDDLPNAVVTVIRNRRKWFTVITDPEFSVVNGGTLVRDVLTSIAESWASYDGDVNVARFQALMPYALEHTHKEMYARCMAAVWQERARLLEREYFYIKRRGEEQ